MEHRHRRRHSSSKASRRLRRIGKAIRWRFLLITFITMLVVGVVGGGVLITDSINRMNSSWTGLNRVLTTLNTKPGTELTLTDFNRLQTSLNDMSLSLASMRRTTDPLRPLAALNNDAAVSLEALQVAQDLIRATQDMLTGLQPTLFFLVAGDTEEAVVAQISSGERVAELLTIGRGRFTSANAHLQAAQARLGRLDLSEVSPDVLLNIEDLAAFHDQIQSINTLLIEAPDLLTMALGLDTARNYLILSQNNDELRPSGGYVSTYGWMTVRNGRISNYSYSPTTATSPYPPSNNLDMPFAVPEWWIQYREPIYAAWDGSWFVDFPATAEMARWYYNAGSNPQSPIDGVIAIDIVGFEYILKVLGSVRMPDYDVVITPNNFREKVYDIRAFGEGEQAHKRFVADLYQQIFSDWQEIDQQKSGDLLGALLQAIQEKHIMLHFADERLNAAVDMMGWSGAQVPALDHDYLLVADANLGNKSNRSIIRQLTYDVEIQPDGSLRSRATVAYDYPASIADQDPAIDPDYHGPLNYNNLMQVFVPRGAELEETGNITSRIHEVETDTHNVFVSRVEIPYNSGERFQFDYTSPPLISSVGTYKQYRLLLQKQPGTRGEAATVQVILPSSAEIISTTPAAAASYRLDQLILVFRVQLTGDQWISVIYDE
jgi:hypothetical protein